MTQIQYSLVASNNILLVEANAGSTQSKYIRACRKILKKIGRSELRRPDGMATLLSGSYAYNYIHGCEPEDDIPSLEALIFLCVTEALPYAATPSETREAAFRFLADIRRAFLEQFRGDLDVLTRSQNLSDTDSISSTSMINIDSAMKSDLRRFSSFMKDEMISFGEDMNQTKSDSNLNTKEEREDLLETKESDFTPMNVEDYKQGHKSSDGRVDLTTDAPPSGHPVYHASSGSKIGKIINQIEQVKVNVRENIDLAIGRGESLSLLHEQAKNMNEESVRFHGQSRRLRSRFCRTLYQQRCIMALVAVFVLYLISAMICGWSWDSC